MLSSRSCPRHRTGPGWPLTIGLLVTLFLLAATPARSQNFDWSGLGVTYHPGTVPAMFLSNDNVAEVDRFLAGQPIKAVKIQYDLSPTTIAAIFNKYKVDYTFVDYETADAVSRVSALVGQMRSSTATGPALTSNKAFVSNFRLSPAPLDPTTAWPRTGSQGYQSAGVNMVADDLYPGSPSYRNPAQGNSTAPNVRSALFTMPIQRLSMTTAALPAGHANLPYVDRFNNWGNSALDSDGDASNGFAFVTSDQLPSRGDFRAQVLHYRLRGANGVHGLGGGVVGYTLAQFEEDISLGWNSQAIVNQIFADPKARLATLDTAVKTDGKLVSMEEVGVAVSGAFSLTQGKMVVLMSNLDDDTHTVSLPSVIGGRTAGIDFLMQAGTHEILEFGLTGTRWNLVSSNPAFVDADRAGVGVPEPAGLGLLVIGGLLVAGKRRRARKCA